MDKKLYIIVLIAVVLIVLGGYLIFTNSGEANVESLESLKTQDFNLFEIDLPEGSNFTLKNEADGMKYYSNEGNNSDNVSSIIISKGLTESLIGDNSLSISNSSTQQIYTSVFKNQTVYKLVSLNDDADFILTGNDLNLLKEVSDTIKIKDLSNL